MPKPRVIDPGFSDDLDVAQLTRDERLLMVIMVSRCADDYGRLIAHPAYLRKQAFGYDEDVSIDDVAQMREHILEHCRNVVLYVVNDQEYIYLSNFAKYQKIRYYVDSKLPPPPDSVASNSREVSEISRESDAKVTPHSPSVGLSSVGLYSSEAGVPASQAPPQDKPEELPFSDPPNDDGTEPIDITGKPTSKQWKDLRWKLADAFTECSDIKMPLEPDSDAAKRKHYAAMQPLWFNPLKDILYRVDWDIPEMKSIVAQAIQEMRRDKLTISTPKSIRKVAVSIVARGEARASPVDDTYMDPDTPMSKAAQAILDRQLKEWAEKEKDASQGKGDGILETAH